MNELQGSPKPERSPDGPIAILPLGRPATVLIYLILSSLAAAVFLPALRCEFLNYDDPVYVTANAHVVRGLDWESVRWAFTNLAAGFWHPLTWLSHMLDCQLFGLKAWGHHLTSLALHLANTLLLFTLLLRLTQAAWRSAIVAALFALHPLHIESVAWVAERKDVLSTFFGFLALNAYARYAQADGQRAARAYAMALFWFACSLMSKAMLVTLPVLLLLLDLWPLKRLNSGVTCSHIVRLLVEKAPFFALSFLTGLLTVHAEKSVGAVSIADQRPLTVLASNATLSCWHYLWQMIWPARLAVFYPYPGSFPLGLVLLGAGMLVAVSAFALRLAWRRPYVTVGWFWYLIALLPVSGLIQVGSHSRADRYTYVPLVGILVLLVWAACELTGRWRRRHLLANVFPCRIMYYPFSKGSGDFQNLCERRGHGVEGFCRCSFNL